MSNTIHGRGTAQPAPGIGSKGLGSVVVPMYGMPVRDAITTTRNELRSEIAILNQALQEGDPNVDAVVGDGKLEGTEWSEVQEAVSRLSDALSALQDNELPDGPGNPLPDFGLKGHAKVPEAFDNGGVHALYGISIMDDVARFRSGISNILDGLTSAINNGEIPADYREEAGRAISAMQDALSALG